MYTFISQNLKDKIQKLKYNFFNINKILLPENKDQNYSLLKVAAPKKI